MLWEGARVFVNIFKRLFPLLQGCAMLCPVVVVWFGVSLWCIHH